MNKYVKEFLVHVGKDLNTDVSMSDKELLKEFTTEMDSYLSNLTDEHNDLKSKADYIRLLTLTIGNKVRTSMVDERETIVDEFLLYNVEDYMLIEGNVLGPLDLYTLLHGVRVFMHMTKKYSIDTGKVTDKEVMHNLEYLETGIVGSESNVNILLKSDGLIDIPKKYEDKVEDKPKVSMYPDIPVSAEIGGESTFDSKLDDLKAKHVDNVKES